MNRPRVALVVSHPIQHFCPQYASLAKSTEYDFKVFFASTMGAVPYEDPNFKQTVVWDNLRLESFDHQFLNDQPLPSSKLLDAKNIAHELDQYGADVVIIYGYWQRFQERVIHWAKSNGKLIYYISDSENHRHEPFLKRIYKSVKLRWHFHHIDRFLTVGNANEFYYHSQGVPTKRMTRMQFSIDVEQFESAFEHRGRLRSEYRSSIQVDDDCVVFSIVGKLVPWKRQRDAILAISKVDSKLPVKLVLLGSGPDQPELEALAQDSCPSRVHFAGFVLPSDLPKCYLGSDVYMHCSEYEPHSLAISEAIYMGLPLLVSDRCGSYGPIDDLQPGRNGFVFKAGDVAALTTEIERMIQDGKMRANFGAESRNYAIQAQHRAHQSFLSQALLADRVN